MKEKERKSIKEEKRNHSLKAEKSPDLKSFKRETSAKKIELKEETKKPASVTVEVKIEKRVTPTKKKIPHEVETNKKVTPTQKIFSLEVETNKVTPTKNKSNDSPHVKEEKPKAETTPDVTEMKKQRSIAFKNFMQRSGPKNPGSKPLPEVTCTLSLFIHCICLFLYIFSERERELQFNLFQVNKKIFLININI